ncbi:hypothetical protein MMC14_001153 [Varicellaria rhodocarpa]|nr:hypothetical protein [Varicellaria rhodocarpa]
MAGFFTNLWESVFTPGPTSTLITATNTAFAALQAVLLALLLATYSVHFVILSFLCAGLWFAINWFVNELQSAKVKETRAKQLKETGKKREAHEAEDSGEDTEEAESTPVQPKVSRPQLAPPFAEDETAKKRRSFGEVSGDMSTDSEWDKVEEEGDMDR